jgi:hypothetical protein
LSPRLDFPQQRSANLLRRVVTDRADLRQLDYSIARVVLEAVTGRSSPQEFRQVPYRKMREKWGLISLCQARNERARGSRPSAAQTLR